MIRFRRHRRALASATPSTLAACLGLALASLHAGARADEPGRIVAATIHVEGAIVERELKVPGGTRHVVMNCVPDSADVWNMRIDGAPDLRVGEVVLEPVLGVDEAPCRDALRDPRAKPLADQKAGLESRVQSDQIALDYLKRWVAPGDAPGPAPAARPGSPAPAPRGVDPGASAEAMRRATRELLEDLQRAQDQLKAVTASLDELDTAVTGDQRANRSWSTARFDVATAAPATLRLRYRVDDVRWTPSYRASLDPSTSTLVLDRLARVSQHSGEAWSGVDVTLSTTDPRGKPQGPLPGTWPIGADRREKESGVGNYFAPAPAPMAAEPQRVEITGSAHRPDVDLAPAQASVDQGRFETLFRTGRPLTTTGARRDQTLVLESVKLPVVLRARVAPRQDPGAWLVVEAARPAGVWPTAWMELLRDGQYVGSARWGAGSEERLTLPFGRDEQVRVEVEHPTPMTADTGLFGGRTERRWADAYTITNGHAAPTAIEVLAALPVSTTENVKVTTTVKPEPATRDWHHQSGVASWTFTLAPKASQRIDIANVVSWPADMSLSGL